MTSPMSSNFEKEKLAEKQTSDPPPKENNTTTDTSNEQDNEEFFPWWRGGGRKPTSGRDFGVWETSLEDRATFWSLWSMGYLNPLLSLGSRKVLDSEDVGLPSQQDQAERAFQAAKNAWEGQVQRVDQANAKLRATYKAKLAKCSTEQEKEKLAQPKWKEASMSTSLVTSFGRWRIILALTFSVVASLLSFVPILILSSLVQYFEKYETDDKESNEGLNHPWLHVAGMGMIPLFVSLLQTRHQTIMAHCSVFVRTAVSTLLYQKSLRVSAAARAKTSTGQVVNMMSNDTVQLQRFLQFAGLMFAAPIQITLALYLIFQQVGNATWVGVGYMVFLAPVNMMVFGVVSKMRRRVLKYSDLRVKMMNEILTGIRILKFYAWEKPFGKEVANLRQQELDALTKLSYTTAIGFSVILLSTPIIQPIFVFLTYVHIQDEPLSASTAFTTVALFNIMRFPFAFMPMGLLQYMQSKISLKRLERYLALPELDPYVQDSPHPDTPSDSLLAQPGSITIKNGTFAWIDPDGPEIKPIQDEKPKREGRRSKRQGEDKSSNDSASLLKSTHSVTTSVSEGGRARTMTLQEISVDIEPGSLVAVVGSVGSGKSSFLSAILGEMESIGDSKVYIPNKADDNEYVSYCAQTPWVVNDTLRGNILFGREYDKARYEETIANCALLDDIDILPAGDMSAIGERGINLSGGQKARVALARAMYSKARLLLLDDPLSAVDAHVGEHIFSKAITGPASKGTTRLLVTHRVHVLARCDKVLVLDHGRILHQGKYQDLIDRGVDFVGAVDVSKVKYGSGSSTADSDDAVTNETSTVVAPSDVDKAAMKKAGETLVEDEERKTGQIDGQTYMRYAKAGGLCLFVLVCVIQGVGRGFEVGGSFWLAHWTDKMREADDEGDPFTDGETSFHVAIYGLFGILGVLCLAFRGIALAKHRLHASKVIHDGITDSILHAPISFFDVTPTGRILNRFAADMDKLDLELTQTLAQGMSTLSSVLGAVGAIIGATKGLFLIPLIPLSYLYFLVQMWFRKSSTELQRITSIANSPIFTDFSQALSGTSTIRAYGVQNDFFEKCKSDFNSMNASYILVQLSNYWLSLRLDILGGVVSMFVGAVAVATLDYGFISAGWLGLALSYSIEMTTYLKFGVQMVARLEADMSSVERILHYTDSIVPEAPDIVPETDPEPGSWPTRGEIELSQASMRYRDGPLVLKDLSFKVEAGEKIGICGRTGSGKSSLMIALFRISEIEDDVGRIIVDGINTKEIGTAALRLNLSIIPQDPVMFSNTLRYNLDPFASKGDVELWDALKKVRLSDVVAALPNGLDEEVAEGGENFSQGQRQLLCIARSLLRNPKILVMDEATASIDNETDSNIQEMIRENFQHATVLTIAHRLNTIMDSDRILVLDDGRIVELDTPGNLLAKEHGHFREMVESPHRQNLPVA